VKSSSEESVYEVDAVLAPLVEHVFAFDSGLSGENLVFYLKMLFGLKGLIFFF
jgi:hypothetical protein